MSGVLDFLFEGRPPPSVTNYGTTTTDLPKWLNDYTQGLIGRANAVAGEGYQPYDGPRLASLTPDQQRAFDITRGSSGSYIPGMTTATQQAGGALGAAMPHLNAAARTYPQAAGEYMNPYIENVTNRAAQLTQRSLDEGLLPSVERVFGSTGSGPRSSAYRRTVDQGVRNLAEGLQAQNLAALASGYESGANIFGADMQRRGALGETIGQLGLESARTNADVASRGQDLALRDAAAQASVGETLQADQQRSLDLAYGDFQAQRDYPRETVDWLSSVIRGMPHNQSTTTNSTGPANVYQPSQASQLGSLITTGLGAWEAWKKGKEGSARGGPIRRKKGGRVVKGALCYA